MVTHDVEQQLSGYDSNGNVRQFYLLGLPMKNKTAIGLDCILDVGSPVNCHLFSDAQTLDLAPQPSRRFKT